MEAVTTNESSPFRWRENNLAERRRMRNDRKKRKRLQRTKCKEDEALNAVSVRIQKEAIQKDRFLALARKYYLKWRQVNEAHKKLQSKANNLSMSSRFGTNPRVSDASEVQIMTHFLSLLTYIYSLFFIVLGGTF